MQSRKHLFLIFFLAAFLLCPTIPKNVEAKEKILNLLILPFVNATGDSKYDSLAWAFGDLLTTSLTKYKSFTVLDRVSLDVLLKEHELSLQGLDDKKKSFEVAKLTGAKSVLNGSILRVNDTFTVSVHVYDVTTTSLFFSLSVSGTLGNLPKDLASKIELEFKLTQEPVQKLPIDQSPEVSTHFIRGLGFYYGNFYDHAIAEFMQALYQNPKYPEARFWLAKSYFEDGSYKHAGVELRRFLREFPKHGLVEEAKELLELTIVLYASS